MIFLPLGDAHYAQEPGGHKAVSVRGRFPPHAMRPAKAMFESGFYSEENVTIKGVKTTPFEVTHELLIQLPESKQTPLWAYGMAVEVYGGDSER